MHTDVDLIKVAIRQRRKKRAQSLTEFALILPLLLFFIMGIIDFGRVLFTYAQASAAIRSALRYASVVGYGSAVYLDCDLMRNTASSIFFDQGTPTVTITYTDYDVSPSSTFPSSGGNCTGDGVSSNGNDNNLSTVQKSAVSNGDILRISADISVAMMTPFFPSPLTFTLAGQRTLVTNISLVDAPYLLPAPQAATQTADFQTFVAGLVYSTQTAEVATATYYQGVTNTAVFLTAETATHEYQLTAGIPTFTPLPTSASTAVLGQVQNLQFWPAGARCSGTLTSRYIGLIWNKVVGVQAYFIYANGVLVGKTVQKAGGTIRQCGRSLSASRSGRISGCFNLNAGAWVGGVSVNYQVAAITNNGAVIGPLSNVLTKTC